MGINARQCVDYDPKHMQFLLGSGSILKQPSFQPTCEAIFSECSNEEGLLSMDKVFLRCLSHVACFLKCSSL